MEDKNNELYIPANIKIRLEFFKGYGVKELVITLLVMAFSLPIVFIINSINGLLTAIIFLFIVTAGTVVSITKDENNLCVAKQIGYMIQNSKMQKKYKYVYYDKRRDKCL